MKPLQIDGLVTMGHAARWAVFSPDMKYRYLLGVSWDAGAFDFVQGDGRVLDIIGKNPSTATHETNDPTLVRLINFGKAMGFSALLLRNVAAYRATDQGDLRHVQNPAGSRNLEVLALDVPNAVRVAAWGAFKHRETRRKLEHWIEVSKTYCTHVFGLTKKGEPEHPLFLPRETKIVPWAEARAA